MDNTYFSTLNSEVGNALKNILHDNIDIIFEYETFVDKSTSVDFVMRCFIIDRGRLISVMNIPSTYIYSFDVESIKNLRAFNFTSGSSSLNLTLGGAISLTKASNGDCIVLLDGYIHIIKYYSCKTTIILDDKSMNKLLDGILSMKEYYDIVCRAPGLGISTGDVTIGNTGVLSNIAGTGNVTLTNTGVISVKANTSGTINFVSGTNTTVQDHFKLM